MKFYFTSRGEVANYVGLFDTDMRQISYNLRVRSLCLLLLLMVPVFAWAQEKGASPAPLGWGSAWTEPFSEKQRQRQDLVRQCRSAEKAGRLQAAVDLCTRWLQTANDDVEIYALRADAYRRLKRYEPALADTEHARKIAEARNRRDLTAQLWLRSAAVHQSMREYPTALTELQASLRLNGDDAVALNSLAWFRATVPDSALRDGRESVRLARKAIALTAAGQTYTVEDTLAAGYAEISDYAQAVDYEKRASKDAEKEIHDAAKEQAFQKEAADRLRLFEQHQPYHADLP